MRSRRAAVMSLAVEVGHPFDKFQALRNHHADMLLTVRLVKLRIAGNNLLLDMALQRGCYFAIFHSLQR